MNAPYQDINITCVCGEKFTWTKGEQLFLDKLLEDGKITVVTSPRRCPECRAKHKELKKNQY